MKKVPCLTIIIAIVLCTECLAVTLTQLTTNPGTDWMPSWSPDGNTIVYVSSPNVIDNPSNPTQDIYTMPVTGGTPTKLTEYSGVDGYRPMYSPDGTKVLYSTTRRSQGLGLWTTPIRGVTRKKVYDGKGNDYYGCWSPDGGMVVFYSEKTKPASLWIASSKGKRLRRLTSEGEYYCPSWHPDGSIIIAHSSRTGNQELWDLSALDGTAKQLTKPVFNTCPNPIGSA